MQLFGQKIHQLRIASGLTLKALAIELGYSAHGYLSEIEMGKKKPTADFVLSIARLFNVTTDQLLKDEIDINPGPIKRNATMADNSFATADNSKLHIPSQREIEQIRLLLSTYQDGSGQLQSSDYTLPGWRDFERTVAYVFKGKATEGKQILDVVLTDNSLVGICYGISCKMKENKGQVRAHLELSNASKTFWQALEKNGLTRADYKASPEAVGSLIIQTVEQWHTSIKLNKKIVNIDRERSFYLLLSWNSSSGFYQLYQFPFRLPDPKTLRWNFPINKDQQNRLVGNEQNGRLFEWYGNSGGQLKYYPRFETATWASAPFQLEVLPIDNNPLTPLGKVERYFPQLWNDAFVK